MKLKLLLTFIIFTVQVQAQFRAGAAKISEENHRSGLYYTRAPYMSADDTFPYFVDSLLRNGG